MTREDFLTYLCILGLIISLVGLGFAIGQVATADHPPWFGYPPKPITGQNSHTG